MCGISADIYQTLRSSLSADLRVTAPLPLAAVPVGCKLLRVAHTPVTSLKDVPEHISSRRVWVQVSNPLRPERELSPESQEVIRMWLSVASAPQPFRTLLFRPLFVCDAYADACADSASAGLGGFIRLPDGRQACFAQTLSASQLHDFFPWFPADASPQHCVAAWEMLAQVALLWILSRLLPPGHAPFHVVFRTDNSPSQSAAWKGLTLARGMCLFLRSLSTWIPSQVSLMTLRTPSVEPSHLPLWGSCLKRFCPYRGPRSLRCLPSLIFPCRHSRSTTLQPLSE